MTLVIFVGKRYSLHLGLDCVGLYNQFEGECSWWGNWRVSIGTVDAVGFRG